MAQLSLSVKKKVGDQGKLFGAVTSQEIADLVAANGVEIDRRKLQLSEPIKALGEFKVPIKLHPEITAEIQLTVTAEESAETPATENASDAGAQTEAPVEESVENTE